MSDSIKVEKVHDNDPGTHEVGVVVTVPDPCRILMVMSFYVTPDQHLGSTIEFDEDITFEAKFAIYKAMQDIGELMLRRERQ